MRGIQAIAFAMENSIGAPRLEIGSIRIARDSPGDAVLDPGPVIDEFGQCIRAAWRGKPKTLASLKRDWDKEDRKLAALDSGYCSYGGYAIGSVKSRATGFFRCEKIEGRWRFVDPDGHLFLSAGSDVITPWMETPADSRSSLFQMMPPEDLLPPRRGTRGAGVSFFTWNLFRRFGSDWMPKWIDQTIRRMDAWGLNTVGNWSHSALWEAKRKAYVIP